MKLDYTRFNIIPLLYLILSFLILMLGCEEINTKWDESNVNESVDNIPYYARAFDTLAIDYLEELIQVTNLTGLGNIVPDVCSTLPPHKLILIRDNEIIYRPGDWVKDNNTKTLVYQINEWQAIYFSEVQLVVKEERKIQNKFENDYSDGNVTCSFALAYYSSILYVYSAFSGELIETKTFSFSDFEELPSRIYIQQCNSVDENYIKWNDIEGYLISLMNKEF